MRNSNFSFDGTGGILLGDEHVDIHGEYVISFVTINFSEDALHVGFKAIAELPDTIEKNPSSLHFSFSGVRYLQISCSFDLLVDAYVEEFGFKGPADKSMEWLKRPEDALLEDHLVFGLQDMGFIRVDCAECRVHWAQLQLATS